MTARSKRLQRVLRKYAIDRRLAGLALAKAEGERAALQATEAQLANARKKLTANSVTRSGDALAAACEWNGRLLTASQMLRPTMLLAAENANQASQLAQLASGRTEVLQGQVAEALHNEDRQREMRAASANAAWRKLRK
jgi:hypothetical protein